MRSYRSASESEHFLVRTRLKDRITHSKNKPTAKVKKHNVKRLNENYETQLRFSTNVGE